MMRHEYRTLWLSDTHLGTSACRAADLLAFLERVSAEVIYLTGDIVDLERMKFRPVFPPLHRRVVGRFLELARTGNRVIYVPGNHDMEFRQLAGVSIGGIEVALEQSHECADGKRLLVMHGDCIDSRIRRSRYVAQIGSTAYRWLVEADVRLNQLRSRTGNDYSSLSTKIKLRLRSANDYIRSFEETAARYALKRGFDGVVCGHIHRPCIRDIEGICYANDGDWVEHRSALVETSCGQLELLRWATDTVVAAPRSTTESLAA
jgi:UDP-2,3-diacylglucosamine pyrophosphatase LpxH